MMHTSDHRRSVWYKKSGFTPSSDALYRSFTEEEEEEEEKMMTKIRKSHMSDFSSEVTKVCFDP